MHISRTLGLALLATLTAFPLRAAETPLRQVIDTEVQAAWKQQGLTMAAPASDAELLRRLSLDLVGDIPTADEARAFLDDASPDKREKLIDRLLDDPRFAAHQAAYWDLLMFGRSPSDQELTTRREGFQKWLREKFVANEPYDAWVQELLLAEGPTYEGPTMFFAQFRNRPEDAAETVSRIFLGTQIHCARCHDHPFDKWLQTDFYGMAGFFVRIAYVDTKADGKRHYILAEKNSGEVLFTGPAAEQKPGQKGMPVAPRFLDGDPLVEPPLPEGFKEPDLKGITSAPKPLFSRKEKFAEWVTRADNPYFTKAVVNRVWSQFLGRGLVDPVDDIRESQPVTLPGLFVTLEQRMKAQQHDMKWFIREVVNSKTYQLSSAGLNTAASPKWYERGRVRPLTAEEMATAFRRATGFDDALRAAGTDPAEAKFSEDRYFLRSFGEPTNGRGEFQPSLDEHLYLNNSGNLRQLMIQPKKGNLADTLQSSADTGEQRVERLFLSVLTRRPTDAERERFVEYLAAEETSSAAIEEAIWVLLNTSEFRFNH